MSTTSRPQPLKALTTAAGALAAAGLAAGAFSAFSRMHYRRSASATLVEYGTLPVKKLTSRVPITERIAWMASRPEPRRVAPFPAWGRLFYDLERHEDDGMPVYTLRPHSPSDTIIVYLHGGGYVSTAVLPHSLLVDTLARKDRGRGRHAALPAGAPSHVAGGAPVGAGALSAHGGGEPG